MPAAQPFEHLVSLFIYATLVPVTLFVLLYGIRSVWYRSWTGRWAFLQASSLALLLWVIALAITFPDWAGRPYVRLTCYGFLCITQILGVAVLIYQQRKGNRE